MQVGVGLINIVLAILVVTGVLSGVAFAWIFLIEAIAVTLIAFGVFLSKL